jgi:hypothetical protein
VPKHIAVSLMLRRVSVDEDPKQIYASKYVFNFRIFNISENHVHIDDHYSADLEYPYYSLTIQQ